MNKKHFVVYFENGEVKTMTSRDWAKENPNHFKVFNKKNPTSNQIDHYLVENMGFTLIADDEKFICFKLIN